ncbi:Tetraspanin-15 [Portunus trituberculatus]|uniref:Tetraspanin-15 n=1 Tax=Portunus trituberculatus TaxID=210409 RepID=A0A5B7DTY1_PORTR|nr:Tetraspanin-15 [Portunus trituberculatus]
MIEGDEAVEVAQLDKDDEVDEVAEAGGFLRWLIRYMLERSVVTWDIGQRERALRAARVQCYAGLMLIMLQAILHNAYKSSQAIEPLSVSLDQYERVWHQCGYYITLVWASVVYLSMLHFTSVIGGSPGDTQWWWWRLDNRSLVLVTHLAPLWCLVLMGQMMVSLTYPAVYKTMIYRDFMNNIDEYYTSPETRIFIDTIQEKLKCCGFHSYQDWVRLRRTRGSGPFPITCCEEGSLCDHENVVNYLANYKTWYETEDYSVMHTKVPFKEKIKKMKNAIHDTSDDYLPFRDKGCAEKIQKVNPFFWPGIVDMIQILITLSVMINIRRYSTGTAFASQAMRDCPRDYIMFDGTHACPRWTFLRPTKQALWRWQQDYLVSMYFNLVYQGKMMPERYHNVIYPYRSLSAPDFAKSFDMRLQDYLNLLRYQIGKQKKKGRLGKSIPFFG